MSNPFLNLLSLDAPGTILGVVIGDGKFACKVKFARGTSMDKAGPWLVEKFCRWAKCQPEQVESAVSMFEFTVEMRLKGQ